MIKTKILVAVMVLFMAFSMSAYAKLYKWVDDQGVTHYGSVIPPEYANQSHVQINKQGVEVKDKPVTQPGTKTVQKPVKSEAEVEQERRDQALLGSFSNEGEIDLARDRNLQQINARTNGIKMQMKTAQDDLAGYQKERDSLTKAGKPVDKILQQQIDQTNNRLQRLQDELSQSEKDADAIRARYDADKKRYHELTTHKAEQ